jgi:ADP-ribose pyrophosphatase YjhB (NUDIX family)
MSRTTKIVGLSLPPEIHEKIESLAKSKHKTRSELYREMIDLYFKESNIPLEPTEYNLANILKSYWLLKSQSKLTVLTVGLGVIINEQGKVLIGARKTKDKWVEELTWVFPGGKMESLDFEKSLAERIKEETNLNVKINSLIASRIHPDAGFKDVQIVALYFHCTPQSKKTFKPGGDLKQLKWTNPTEIFRYFTTSTCDDVTKFLYTIQKSHNY